MPEEVVNNTEEEIVIKKPSKKPSFKLGKLAKTLMTLILILIVVLSTAVISYYVYSYFTAPDESSDFGPTAEELAENKVVTIFQFQNPFEITPSDNGIITMEIELALNDEELLIFMEEKRAKLINLILAFMAQHSVEEAKAKFRTRMQAQGEFDPLAEGVLNYELKVALNRYIAKYVAVRRHVLSRRMIQPQVVEVYIRNFNALSF